MNGNGRKPLRCPCCLIGGHRAQDPTDLIPEGRLRKRTLKRQGRLVQRWVVFVQCQRCGWNWWSANPAALERAMKLERARLSRTAWKGALEQRGC